MPRTVRGTNTYRWSNARNTQKGRKQEDQQGDTRFFSSLLDEVVAEIELIQSPRYKMIRICTLAYPSSRIGIATVHRNHIPMYRAAHTRVDLVELCQRHFKKASTQGTK
jgi:hypothetical protein